MDDISHINFTDRDHLWFDPNWHNNGSNSKSSSSSSNNNNRDNDDEIDPMAAMLENNARNPKASHVFVNDLHNAAPEYAEVDPEGSTANAAAETNTQLGIKATGAYATTNIMGPGSHFGSRGSLDSPKRTVSSVVSLKIIGSMTPGPKMLNGKVL